VKFSEDKFEVVDYRKKSTIHPTRIRKIIWKLKHKIFDFVLEWFFENDWEWTVNKYTARNDKKWQLTASDAHEDFKKRMNIEPRQKWLYCIYLGQKYL